jgi:hypothetical protein
VWKVDGRWTYDATELKEEFNMGVPIPDEIMCQIEYLLVGMTKEILTVLICPSGCFGVHLLSTKKKG